MQTTAATPIVERYPPLTAGNPAYQGFRVLHVGFTLLPILAGADKFFGVLTDWTQYLAPQVPRLVNLPAQTFMMIVGGVEIVAGPSRPTRRSSPAPTRSATATSSTRSWR